MTDPVTDFAAPFRPGDPILRNLLEAATNEEADRAVRDEDKWAQILLKDIAPPMGVLMATVLEYIHDATPEEMPSYLARLNWATSPGPMRMATGEFSPAGYLSVAHNRATQVMDIRLSRMRAEMMRRLNERYGIAGNAPPRSKSGPPKKSDGKALECAQQLRRQPGTISKAEAAKKAVAIHGRGERASNGAAIDAIRKAIE